GGPVPGYAAPEERTTGPGTRVARTLLEVLAEAHAAGRLEPAPRQRITAELAEGLAGIRSQFELDLPQAVLVRAVLAWTGLFGVVSFEVFGQYGPDRLGDPDALFELHLAALTDGLGLPAGRATRSRS
ncbi:MAG TPA: TetR-like C-terminal domain-containing protein, partial [Nocardioides sp.]|nr:TetR-like C-terminal domain-containing protein [Nocardioides sp.]